MATPNSYKPVVQTDSTNKWYDNALRFRTREEALRSARDLMNRWMLVLACDAHPSDDEPNYRYTEDGRLEELPAPKTAILPVVEADPRIAGYIAEIEQPGIPYISNSHHTLYNLQREHGEDVVRSLIDQYFAAKRAAKGTS